MNVLLVDPVGDLREVERSLRADGSDAVIETVEEPAAAAGSDFDPDCAVVLDHATHLEL